MKINSVRPLKKKKPYILILIDLHKKYVFKPPYVCNNYIVIYALSVNDFK